MIEKNNVEKRKEKKFKFNTENLTKELKRLKKLFLSGFKVPEIKLEVKGRVYTKSAYTYYTQNRIVMFKAYHDKFPEDYKVTLLHEVGHIVADHGHGSNFKKYFNLLKKRQKNIEEKIIPDSYADFLFAKIPRNFTKKYYCPVCRDIKVYRKSVSTSCSRCEIPLLEDSFFQGVKAIVSSSLKQQLDLSAMKVGLLTPATAIRY
mgnify:CR=1 FL=1